MARTKKTFEELESVKVPMDVPELGVSAGDSGAIERVYDGGRMLSVEIPKDDGTSAGFVDLRVEEDGSLELVSYSKMS